MRVYIRNAEAQAACGRHVHSLCCFRHALEEAGNGSLNWEMVRQAHRQKGTVKQPARQVNGLSVCPCLAMPCRI